MKAGELRHRVTLQHATTSQDEYGEAIESWSELDTVWAAVEPMQGREFLEGRRLEQEVTTRIRIRYRDDLQPLVLRATWGSHTYDVVAVLEVQSRRREIHLMCREIP